MAVQNTLANRSQKQTFSTFLTSDAIKTKINQMVGGKNGERFITALISAVSNNPALAECDHTTILSAAMLGEALNLSPSPQLGRYYLVPFKNKKKSEAAGREVKDAQFVLGYKGYIELAIRTAQYRKINVVAIKEGEFISYNPLDEELKVKLITDDSIRENTKTTGYYVMFELINGFKKCLYWSREKMEIHADKYSSAYSLNAHKKLIAGEIPAKDLWKYSSYWYTDFDGQAHKTMLRQLISKWGIMSIELQKAFENDMAVIDSAGNPQFVDNSSDYIDVSTTEQTPQIQEPNDDPFTANTAEPKPADFIGEKELEELSNLLGKDKYLDIIKENNNQITFSVYYDLKASLEG